MGWQEELRAKRAETDRWIRQREADLRRAASQAEARGRQVYANAIKTGERVLARTPAEIRVLGAAALKGQLPQALAATAVKAAARPAAGQRGASGAAPRVAKPSVREEFRAAVSGAVDEASLGLADHVLAGVDAAKEAVLTGSADNLLGSYRDGMADKRAADAYDAEHHGTSRNVGRVVGLVGTVAAMGAPGLARAAIASVPRGRVAAQVAKYGLRYAPDPRGLTKMMAGVGAVGGVLDQAATDLVTGHQSGPRDLLAAAGGGALGGAMTRYAGPVLGGGVGGSATSVLTDLANDRAVSLDDALDAGRLGAVFGGLGGELGERWVRKLPSHKKGSVGDALSAAKIVARGEQVVGQQRRIHLRPAGEPPAYTVADNVSVPRGLPDHPDNWIIGESKLGPSASLSDRQEEALQTFGDRYVTDFWRYSDVGNVAGAAMSPYGSNALDRRDR